MLVSVVIPVYNRAETILRALDSVVKQQCVNFDIWVIDDGSSDDTGAIVEQYIQENFLEQKIHYIKISNSGVSTARNIGIEASSGEWLAFLDSDDEWLPEKLRLQVDHITENESCRLVHADEIWIRNGKRVNQMKKHRKSGGDIFLRSLELCLVSPSAVMIKRTLLEEVGYFDPKMTVCEDYDLWLRISSLYEVDYIETPLIKKYGGHDDQLSRKFSAMDFWRVLAIDKVLGQQKLEKQKQLAAIAILSKKCEILLSGFLKHNNMSNFEQISAIFTKYSGKKFL